MHDTGTSSPSPSARRLALAQCLACFVDIAVMGSVVVVTLLLFPSRFEGGVHVAVMMMGMALAIVSIVSAWVPLGPLPLSVRVVAAPLICLVALLLAALLLAASDVDVEPVIGILIAGVAQFVVLQAPYWLFRQWHHLRIVHRGELAAEGLAERLQYSLGQMLLVTTLVAVALAIGRGIFSLASEGDGPRGSVLTLAVFFMLLVGYNLLLAWPLLWAVLATRGIVWRLAAAAVLVALVLVSAYPLCVAVLGSGEGRWIFWLTFAPLPAYLLTHLFATRLCGYRLLRYAVN